jgi:predicted nuclease of restriction endonuclease-like (RecB) superfamily
MRTDINEQEEGGGMNFEWLVIKIRSVHDQLAKQASKAVNLGLTLRNWLIGCHIQEFELRGEDRSQYGDRLFDNLADRLGAVGVPGCDRRQLYRYVDFYRLYPQIAGTLSPQFRGLLPARPAIQKVGALSPRSLKPALPIEALVEALSYSHFELLAAIDDPLKRAFYEFESVRGTWSVRELKRQIASLYYERSGLSRNKKKLATMVDGRVEHSTTALTIRDPYVLEFLGMRPDEVMPESRLEHALLGKLEAFLLELGRGFCFEARQRRLLIGGEHFFVGARIPTPGPLRGERRKSQRAQIRQRRDVDARVRLLRFRSPFRSNEQLHRGWLSRQPDRVETRCV